MKIEATHVRSGPGHAITVKATREGTETLARVQVSLDRAGLANDVLEPAQVYYERSFNQVGRGGPGDDHVLLVVAEDATGASQAASFRWEDPV